jgi:hypothetical protein
VKTIDASVIPAVLYMDAHLILASHVIVVFSVSHAEDQA